MKHFGAIANVGGSHVQTMCTLGRILQGHGHRFTLFGTAKQAEQADRAGVASVVLGADDPAAELAAHAEREHTLRMSAYLAYMKRMAVLLCDASPAILRREGVDFLLADQEEPAAATAADLSSIPYATICSSVPLNEDAWVPPNFVPWPGSSQFWTRAKNALVYRTRNLAVFGLNRTINRYRKKARLPLYRKPEDSFSGLAQITQLVREIDFARERNDPLLRYVGPYQRRSGRDRSLPDIPFPFEKLDGRPLVYASFGTLKYDVTAQFAAIASGCAGLPVQLVISLGGGSVDEAHARFPGNPIVVSYAPQLELLSRAAVFVTHGGVNSVMESLSCGVPLLVLPRHGDQFGMGARVAHHRAGLVSQAKSFNAAAVRTAIVRVMADPVYRAAAVRMQEAIARTGGAVEAVDIIESQADREQKTGAFRG